MSRDAPEPRRIVSLLPAATEIVYALGEGARLVGASHECDHPEAARGLPRVSRPRIDVHAPSAELDKQVKSVSARGESLYDIDAKLLKRLAPDLILTQVPCDVCAVTPKDLEAATAALRPRPRIVALDAQSLEGVLSDIRLIGETLGRAEEAKLLVFKQWRLTKEIRSQVEDLEPPKVALVDWVDPLMFAGNWMPELAAIAGGRYGLVERGKPSRWGSWEELEDYAPEVILAVPCGRDTATTRAELSRALAAFRPDDIPALEQKRIFLSDGNRFFNRPGPRLIYSAALMARAFHGDRVRPLPPVLERELVRLDAR